MSPSRACRVFPMAAAIALAAAAALPAPASEPDAAVAPESREALRAMSDLLGGADAFSFDAYITREEVSTFGQKVEFSQQRQVLLERPGGIRVTGTGDVSPVDYCFNNGTFTGHDPQRQVWTSVEVPDTIEPMLDHLAFELGMVVPIADLLVDEVHARHEGVAVEQ